MCKPLRVIVLGVSCLATAFGGATTQLAAQGGDATQVLAAAREAMGGEKKLSAVKSFVATGRTRQVRGNNLVPIEFEINCELPDKFVRKDDFPAQDAEPTTLGFNGDTLIQFPPPPARGTGPGGPARGAGPGAAPPPAAGRGDAPASGARGGDAGASAARGGDAPARGGAPAGPGGPGRGGPGGPGRGGIPPPRIVTVKQDFARLTLGMFATSFPSFPLTFKYAAQAEAPEGKADVLDVTGPNNFSARLLVQRDTHLPVMLMWQQPAPNPQVPAVEQRLYYADYRDVDGLKLPFRIRRAVGSETVEETTFDRFRINAKIDPRKFESPK